MVVKVTNVALLTLFQQVVTIAAIAAATVEPADLPPVVLVLLMM